MAQGLYAFIKDAVKYKDIKNSDRRAKSVTFGVKSIICALVGAAVLQLCPLGVTMLSGGLVSIVVGILALAFGAIAAILMFFTATVCVVYQLTLNRRAIGWIALALLVALIAVAAVLFVLII